MKAASYYAHEAEIALEHADRYRTLKYASAATARAQVYATLAVAAASQQPHQDAER